MTAPDKLLNGFALALEAGEPIRQDFGRGERLHIDRPLPFLMVHVGRPRERAAREIVTASSSYLIASSKTRARAIIELVCRAMTARFGAFIVLDIGELPQDKLPADAAELPPFELTLSGSKQAGTAASTFAAAIEKLPARYRTPSLARPSQADDPHAGLARLLSKTAFLTLRFAPIHRVPESTAVYPQLLEQLVANLIDASLRAIASFVETTKALAISSHRALGRKAFLDAVTRADRAVDDIAQAFDFLLALTPINAAAAWAEFEASGFEHDPRLLYRPLTLDVSRAKKQLHSIDLDQFEDPVLTTLYREKQQELDLQLSLLAARETPRFVELGRALYGPVEPRLFAEAEAILAATRSERGRHAPAADGADSAFVARQAETMINRYTKAYDGFSASIELREDLPSGLMVSGGRLLIARTTTMPKARVEALLSHEVGVHLLTYFNGSAQGLRLFRSGLAGYEGVQEGLAVLAEFLVGGMTLARLRLIAARVVGVATMLDGASFTECYRRIRDYGLPASSAFNLVLRVYRGGGLVKDAIYLRGLLEVLAHLRAGGDLGPFWMGKIAAGHFGIMQELSARGLLRAARVQPAFLDHPGAPERLQSAIAGITPVDMIER